MNNIIGRNGVEVIQVAKDAFNSNFIVKLEDNALSKIDEKADISLLNYIENELNERIDNALAYCDSLCQNYSELLEKVEKENKELRKIIANLNTRVNDLIAEKQVKEFYEKSN